MSLRNEIKHHARRVAKDVKAGKPSARADNASEFMRERPEAVLGVLDLVRQEADRTPPDNAAIQAHIYMFGAGLDEIRYPFEGEQDWAVALVEAVLDRLLLLAEENTVPPHLLMRLVNAFVEAKLAPGDDLIELLGDVALDTAADQPVPTEAEIGEMFESIVEDAGGDEFELHATLAESGNALPPEFRMEMLNQFTTSGNPVLRDTATLYLLDDDREVRRTASRLIGEHAASALVSPVALRRMITIRNWLPNDERRNLDAAIKLSRQKQIECAPWPPAMVEEIIVSNMDGGGAQSVFAIAKDGRKRRIACLLVKQGVGIADAWRLRGQTKAEVREFLEHIHAETDSHAVERDFLEVLVPHYMEVGRKSGNPPAAGLLEFMETVGQENWRPREVSPDNLLSLLEQGADPTYLQPAAVAETIDESGAWLDAFDFMESWFEEGAEVDAALSKYPGSGTPAQIDAIVESVLEPHRAIWAERFLWTALWLKQDRDLLSPWREFFVVGRELHRRRPIADIAVMRSIAEVTAMVGTMRE